MRSELSGSANSISSFLQTVGAERLPHERRRTLFDHLIETRKIVERWSQPAWVQDAAALHTVYGTSVYRTALVGASKRDQVRAVAGRRAERLAYLFGAVDRRALFAWCEAPHPAGEGGPTFEVRFPDLGTSETLTRREAGELLVLHMANLAEQASGAEGLPGQWLACVSRWGTTLAPMGVPAPTCFAGCSSALAVKDEHLATASYVAGLDSSPDDHLGRERLFGSTSQHCPWVGEPWVFRAWQSLVEGCDADARVFASEARHRFVQLGTCWDKRLSFDSWLALTEILDLCATRGKGDQVPPLNGRRLADSVQLVNDFVSQIGPKAVIEQAPDGRDSDAQRFSSYVDTFVGWSKPMARVYPGLTSRPWHERRRFELVEQLESSYPKIKREMSQVDPMELRPESESIPRTGSWDVFMLFEHGRKHDEACARCPVTTQIIEENPATPTPEGLIYFSRMAPGTHVSAHRGPTNIRLRCHLGLQVPEGDCAIRVGEEVHKWREGRCLVFDDRYEHEAWNHSTETRVVLVVDFWHPDLSEREISLLWGLDYFALSHARRKEARRKPAAKGQASGRQSAP